jgi:hypothetical protein
MVITLDAGPPFAGHLPDRRDLIYFVTRPCHPPIFNIETDMVAKNYFGGIVARQHIVNALMQDQRAHVHSEAKLLARSGPESCARTM